MPLDLSNIIGILKRVHLFQNIEEQKIETAAALVDEIEVAKDQVIFYEGDKPDYFYIIASGQVRITTTPNRNFPNGQLGILEDDDYFGEEVLESNWQRQVTATAASDTTLLAISIPNFIQILDLIASKTFERGLQLILDSYRLRLRTNFSWLENDESVVYIARKHPIILYKMVALPTLSSLVIIPLFAWLYLTIPMYLTFGALLLAIVGCVVWWVWSYVDWSNDYYIVTSQRAVYQERVVLLYDSRQESPLWALQSSNIHTSQWGRWLGFGNVAVRTFYGTILFRDIANPSQVMALMQQVQLRAQFSQRRQDIRDIKDYLTRRMKFGPERPNLSGPKKAQPKQDPTRAFVSNMFHLRYETGNTVIYRTHWFILLKRIWLPSLLLLALFTLFILSISNQFALISLQATCGLIFLFGLIFSGWWFYQYMDWHNDLYLITNDQVVDVYKKPLGQEERQAAPIKNILSIEYKRLGLIGLFLNFGTVYIRVGDKQLTFDEVYRPSEVQRELFHALAKANANEKKQQAETDKRRLGDWFDSFAQWEKENRPPTASPESRGGL